VPSRLPGPDVPAFAGPARFRLPGHGAIIPDKATNLAWLGEVSGLAPGGCLQLARRFAARPYAHVMKCPAGKWSGELQTVTRAAKKTGAKTGAPRRADVAREMELVVKR
jgi:hypothetical protein